MVAINEALGSILKYKDLEFSGPERVNPLLSGSEGQGVGERSQFGI